MKLQRIILTLALSVFLSGPALAQVPVTDTLAIAKAIQQLAAWKQQYEQMQQAIQTSKSQLESLTGKRMLGTVLDGISTDATVPSNISAEWGRLTKLEDLMADATKKTSMALQVTSHRAQQVRMLMDAVNNTKDPKAIAEITARIGAELALIKVDESRISLMHAEVKNNVDRIEEIHRAKRRQEFDLPSPRWTTLN